MPELGGTRALVSAGARVAITSRDAGRAALAAADLGPGALGLALDVRDDERIVATEFEQWLAAR